MTRYCPTCGGPIITTLEEEKWLYNDGKSRMTKKDCYKRGGREIMKDIPDSVMGCVILLLLIGFPIACLIFMLILSCGG